MTFQEKLKNVTDNMYKHISINELTLLEDLDTRANIIKDGKYNYHVSFRSSSESLELFAKNIKEFLNNNLEEKRIYIIIPFLTANNNPNEP
jgi:hypothetical protein